MTDFYNMTKRGMDMVLSLFALIVLSPALLMIWGLIKLSDRKHGAFFSQIRVGKDGNRFEIYKFRTMVVNAEEQLDELLKYNDVDGITFKMRRDPRVTKVGAFLRKTSLDELPQFLNVLRGDMAIVGPRPALEREVAAYSEHDLQRLNVLPGITGLWQVSGRSGTTFEYMIEKDLEYIRKRNLLLDLKIIMQTIFVVVIPNDAY